MQTRGLEKAKTQGKSMILMQVIASYLKWLALMSKFQACHYFECFASFCLLGFMNVIDRTDTGFTLLRLVCASSHWSWDICLVSGLQKCRMLMLKHAKTAVFKRNTNFESDVTCDNFPHATVAPRWGGRWAQSWTWPRPQSWKRRTPSTAQAPPGSGSTQPMTPSDRWKIS